MKNTATQVTEDFKELRDWLKKDGNSLVKLAGALNYKSSSTISYWLTKKHIPRREREKVLNYLRSKS